MAGAGYKLFNTGDVLTAAQVNTYLMEQTVMVFADAAARTAALSGVVSEGMISYLKDTNAVEVYNGSAWVASDDPNAIQNTIVDAKGDLITATAADTPARLAVGSDGSTLVADSSASTGLRWQQPKPVNAVYNSSFDIWQRGTSSTGAAPYYGADRWIMARDGGVSGATFTRQSSGLTGFIYSARAQRNSGTTNTNPIKVGQSLENADAIRFAGKTVTFSFYAKAGANYSATSNALQVALNSGTGTDQQFWVTGFTGDSAIINTTVTLTTSWQRFSLTGTVSSSATQIAFGVQASPQGTAGANDWYEITGIQLEEGLVATPYTRQSATLAGELAACQRYYWRDTAQGTTSYFTGFSPAASSTGAFVWLTPPTNMRVLPTAVDYASCVLDDGYSANFALTSFGISTGYSTANRVAINATVASGLTSGRVYAVRSNASTGYIGLSAEL